MIIYDSTNDVVEINGEVLNNVEQIYKGYHDKLIILHRDNSGHVYLNNENIVFLNFLDKNDKHFFTDFLFGSSNSIVFSDGHGKYFHINLITKENTDVTTFVKMIQNNEKNAVSVGDRFMQYGNSLYDIVNDKWININDGRTIVSGDFLNGKTNFFYVEKDINRRKNFVQYSLYFYDKEVLKFKHKISLTQPFQIEKPIVAEDKYLFTQNGIYEINHNNGEIRKIANSPYDSRKDIYIVPKTITSPNELFITYKVLHEPEKVFGILKEVNVYNVLTQQKEVTQHFQKEYTIPLSTVGLFMKILSLFKNGRKDYYLSLSDNLKYLTFKNNEEHKIIGEFLLSENIFIAKTNKQGNNYVYLVKIQNGEIFPVSDYFNFNTKFYKTGINGYALVFENYGTVNNKIHLINYDNKEKTESIIDMGSKNGRDFAIEKLSDELILIKDLMMDDFFVIYNVKTKKQITPILKTTDNTLIYLPMTYNYMNYFCIYDWINSQLNIYNRHGNVVLTVNDRVPYKFLQNVKQETDKLYMLSDKKQTKVFPKIWKDFKHFIANCLSINNVFNHIQNSFTKNIDNRVVKI